MFNKWIESYMINLIKGLKAITIYRSDFPRLYIIERICAEMWIGVKKRKLFLKWNSHLMNPKKHQRLNHE